jgi:recombination protein RecT
MTVRGAVAKRDAQPAQVSPATIVQDAIRRQSKAFKAVLPKTVDPDRFSRLVLSAVKAAPELVGCFSSPQGTTSVLLAAMQAAAIGLEPNTPTQEAWILPRKNKGVWEAQLSIGYRGMMKLARRTGTIKTIYTEVVHEADHFEWAHGLESDVLEHRPFDGPDDQAGALTHAYAVARFTNGGYSFMVLNRSQVEKRRAMSDSWKNDKSRPYSPWTKWTEAMWRKSAIRALVPYLDLSPETERALHHDETPLRIDPDEETIDIDWDDADSLTQIEAAAEPEPEPDDGHVDDTSDEPEPEPVDVHLAEPAPTTALSGGDRPGRSVKRTPASTGAGQ